MDDNFLKPNGSICHNGENVTNDEELTPTLENIIVITWLRLVHPDLLALTRQRYGTKVLNINQPKAWNISGPRVPAGRNSGHKWVQSPSPQSNAHLQTPPNTRVPGTRRKICPLCQQANRSQFHHYLSKYSFLPASDPQVISESLDIKTASDYIETPPGHN